MPTKQIMLKLIRRATQIKDVINELNPYDQKSKPEEDNKIHKVLQKRLSFRHIHLVHGSVIYSGDDLDFNALRVLPPSEFQYPDILRDGDKFYEKIMCPNLKAKYSMQEKFTNERNTKFYEAQIDDDRSAASCIIKKIDW